MGRPVVPLSWYAGVSGAAVGSVIGRLLPMAAWVAFGPWLQEQAAVSSNWSFSMTKRTLRLVNKMGTCPGTYLTTAPLVWEVGGV